MSWNSDLNSTNLLIDLNSPVPKRTLDPPLIPVPKSTDQNNYKLSLSPISNNPFDNIERQIGSPDPFEKVLKNASKNSHPTVTCNSEHNKLMMKDGMVEKTIADSRLQSCSVYDLETNKTIIKSAETMATLESILSNESNKELSQINKNYEENLEMDDFKQCAKTKIEANQISPTAVVINLPEIVCSEEIVKEILTGSEAAKTDSDKYDDDSINISSILFKTPDTSNASLDVSSEEGIKAVIAQRVNKCIRKALTESLTCFEQSTAVPPMFINRRSLSFVKDSSAKKNKCDERLNKSCTDSFSNETFNLEKVQLQMYECSSDKNNSKLNVELVEHQKPEQSVLDGDDEKLFKEANKLARTFSRIADSFCHNAESESDDEDLLSCKPRWLSDSSEDESERLKRDPALNVRVSLTPQIPVRPLAPTDSQALSAFKARQRHSLSNLETSTHSSTYKEDFAFAKDVKGIQPIVHKLSPLLTVKPQPVLSANMNPEKQSLKLKKTSTVEPKRGPMKAVMPIQRMTKEALLAEGKIQKQENISPLDKAHCLPLMETPIRKQSSQLRPVASSTPNKPVSTSQPIAAIIPHNKRLSLEAPHKSRSSEMEGGAKQRSNSANSSIPTAPASVPAALRAKCAQKPKGTLGILRSYSASNSPMNSFSKSSQPKPLPKTKQILKPGAHQALPQEVTHETNPNTRSLKSGFNPRALNEIKSKSSPRTSQVKAAMNVLSSLVTSAKNKKTIRDKENRGPV